MADLNSRDGRIVDLNCHDRAQVLLIAGFILAAAFVALALVMNSVIYTENLATRGEQAQAGDAVAYRGDMVRGSERLIEYANHNHPISTPFSNVEDDFVVSIEAMSNRTATQEATDGRLTNTTVRETTEGRRIGQFNASSRNFTNVSGAASWGLASDVEGTRSFTINVTNSSMLTEVVDPSNLGTEEVFTVHVDNGTHNWGVRIYTDGTDTIVNATDADECVAGPDPMINLSAGAIDGSECSGLNFSEGVSAPYTVSYEDSDDIQGNFSLVVNSTTPTTSTAIAANYDSAEDTPFETDAIYAATIHVRYESTDLVYATDARVIPGESDD